MEAQAPANWYQDPWQPGRLRWWDGGAWTGHVRVDDAPASLATLPPPPVVHERSVRHGPTVGARDLAIARAQLTAFLLAVGGDNDSMWDACTELAIAGGSPPTIEASIEETIRTGEHGADRPWRWLAAVGDEGVRIGDVHLVGQVALFTHFWHEVAGKTLTAQDLAVMRLSPSRPTDRGRIISTALRFLTTADPDVIVASNPSGMVTVRSVLDLCVHDCDAFRDHVDAEALAIANRW